MTAYAVQFTATEKAELVAVERDARPLGAREVAGRTVATLISAGTELNGGYLATSGFPRGSGYAAVFEVEEVGSEVESIKVGDLAFCMGPHRSFQRVEQERTLLVPQGLSPQSAAFARMMGVSMSTLTTTTARPPQKVMVMGLGLVGHLAAKIFASCGYEVIAVDPVESRRKMAEESGIRRVLPAAPVDDPTVAGQVALVLECSGHESGAINGCRIVRKRGEVVLIGTPWRQRSEQSAFDVLHPVFHRYVTLRSGWEWELPLHETEFRHNSVYGNIRTALRWLAEGRINVDNLYATAPPRDAQSVYQDLLRNRWQRLGAVFDWRDCP
jgi:threonine dehydrogenase-like Zn-dependent dehydrogenase